MLIALGFGMSLWNGQNITPLKSHLSLIGIVVLIVGLASAIFIYMAVADEPSDVVSYQIVAGQVFVTTANDSKQYRLDVERFGGKAAIWADDFNRWFAGLWKGKRLAYTLLVLSTGCALVCFWGAHRFSVEKTDGQDIGPP